MQLDRFFSERHLKIAAILNYALLGLVLAILILNSPASRYEIDIYSAYPWYFWAVLILGFFTCQMMVIWLSIRNAKSTLTAAFIIPLILIDLILLGLPLIRGYYTMGSGDILTHIGYMRDIWGSGVIPESNMYPMAHILGLCLNFVAAVPLEKVPLIIPMLCSMFFLVAMISLGKILSFDRSQLGLLVAIAAIPLFGVINTLFSPFHDSLLMIPFILFVMFLYISNPGQRIFSNILILLSVVMVFFHPLTSLFVIILLLLGEVYLHLNARVECKGERKSFVRPVVISLIIFSSWSTYAYLFTQHMTAITETVLGKSEQASELQRYSEIVATAQVNVWTQIQTALNIYGQNLVLVGVSLLCLVFVGWQFLKHRERIRYQILYFCVGFFIFIVAAIISLLLIDIFGWVRILAVASLFAIIVLSALIWPMFDRFLTDHSDEKKQVVRLISIGIIVFALLYFSVFNLYLSPIVRRENQQVTESGYTGMDSYLENRDDRILGYEMGISQFRYYDAIYGRNADRKNIMYSDSGQLSPPDHFGYDTTNQFTGNAEAKYLIISDLGRQFYPAIYPEFKSNWRHTAGDFDRIKVDSNMNYIFTNGDLEIYLSV